MRRKRILISVLIPTKNRREALGKMLDSLLRQKFQDFEVVVADGNSTDGTRKMLALYGKKIPVKIVDGEGGLVGAMNNAAQAAKGEVVTRTDDDVVATPGWLENVWKTFEAGEKIGGVTGPTIIPRENIKTRDVFLAQEKFRRGNIFWRLLGKIYYDFFMEGEPFRVSHWFSCGAFSLGSNYKECLRIKRIFEVDNLEACNYSVRRDLLRKVGWFDPLFAGVGEYHEPDAALKIRDLGYKLVFNPKAQVFHCPVQTGIYKARPKSFSRAQNFVNFYFRHIKPDTLNKFFRFYSYLFFINFFWFYKFLTTRQWCELGAIPGTIVAVLQNVLGLVKK